VLVVELYLNRRLKVEKNFMPSTIRTECPSCLEVFKLKNKSSFGKKTKCRKCGKAFVVRPKQEDDFEDDYGDEDDWDTAPAAPVKRTSTKSKKRKSSKPFPWKPIVGVAVGILVLWGGFQAVSNFSSINLATAFESHEGLLDEGLDSLQSLESILASVQSAEDVSAASEKIHELQQQNDSIDERLIALGEIDEKRVNELIEYRKSGQEEWNAAVARVQTQIDRLKQANLLADLRFDLVFLQPVKLDYDLVRNLPEPAQADDPRISNHFKLHYEWTVALRQACLALSKMKDDSSAEQHIAEVTAATEELRRIAEWASSEKLTMMIPASSRYFRTHMHAGIALSAISQRVRQRASGSKAAIDAVS
jgi:hypothetical protein